MLELATTGARVMHARAVEVGEIYDLTILVTVRFHARAGHPDPAGDHHGAHEQGPRHRPPDHVAKITLRGAPRPPGHRQQLFEPLADRGRLVDTIVQNASVEKLTDMTFTVGKADLRARSTVRRMLPASAPASWSDPDLGGSASSAPAWQRHPGYAARMFRTLSEPTSTSS